MQDIDTVVFDMGGVLVDLNHDECFRRFAALGYKEAASLLDPYKQAGIFLELEEGKITPQELYDYIGSKVPGITPAQIDNALFGWLTDVSQSKLDMLLALRSRYKVCMLSNTNVIMLTYIMEKWFSQGGRKPEDYFDRLYLSYEMGIAKPSEEIFLKMIEDSGMEPSRTLFIDDGPANIETARELGFQTHLAVLNENFGPLFNM